MLVVKQVHGVMYGLQALLTCLSHHVQDIVEWRIAIQFSPAFCRFCVFEQMWTRLFRVEMQQGFMLCVWSNGESEHIELLVLVCCQHGSCNEGTKQIALARTLTACHAHQVVAD